MMYIVEDFEQLENVIEKVKTKFLIKRDTEDLSRSQYNNGTIEDYINKPKLSGYRGIHINSIQEIDENSAGMNKQKVSFEIQIKTAGMFLAQIATHDTIYKNDELITEEKNKLSKLMSEVIELQVDVERERKRGNTEEAEKLDEEKYKILTDKENSILLEVYDDIVLATWKEYAKAKFKLTNNEELEDIVKSKSKAEKMNSILDNVFAYYCKKGSEEGMSKEVSKAPMLYGNILIDYAIEKVQSLDYKKIEQILKETRSQSSNVYISDIIDKVLQEGVTFREINSTAEDLTNNVQESQKGQEIDNKQGQQPDER